MTRLTPKESAMSADSIKRTQKQILKKAHKWELTENERKKHVYRMQEAYLSGALNIDRDDPRTTVGYTEKEVSIILDEDDYDDLKQNQEFYEEKL